MKKCDNSASDLLLALFQTRMERLREIEGYWNSMNELSQMFKLTLLAYTRVRIAKFLSFLNTISKFKIFKERDKNNSSNIITDDEKSG